MNEYSLITFYIMVISVVCTALIYKVILYHSGKETYGWFMAFLLIYSMVIGIASSEVLELYAEIIITGLNP